MPPPLPVTTSLPGRPAHRPVRRHAEPTAYDFRKPTKLSGEHGRVLQVALEAFAAGTNPVLTGSLRTSARLTLLGIEQRGYSDYVDTLPEQAFMAVFGLSPLPGQGALTLPLDSAMAAIDHMLGGPGSEEQPLRPMTSVEARLTQWLVDQVLGELAVVFEPFTPLRPRVRRFEYTPSLAQVAAPPETVVIGHFELRVGNRIGPASLCMPFGAIAEPLAKAASPRLSGRERHDRELAAAAMTANLERLPLEVAVRLRPVSVPTADLLALEPGHLVPLRHPSNTPLELATAGRVLAHVIPASHRRRLAATVVPSPEPENGSPR